MLWIDRDVFVLDIGQKKASFLGWNIVPYVVILFDLKASSRIGK